MLDCLPQDEKRPFAERLKRLSLPSIEHGLIAGEHIDSI